MLHILGDPPYVQLLINPDSMVIGIKALKTSIPGDQSHKVPKSSLISDNSVEIYSSSLVEKIIDTLDLDNTYFTACIDGEIVGGEVALFDLHQILGKETLDEDFENRQ